MTWKQLRDKISRMTEEEQLKEVAIWGEDFSLRDRGCCLVKTTDAVYDNKEWDECCEGGELEPEDLEAPGTYKVCEKGLYYILG